MIISIFECSYSGEAYATMSDLSKGLRIRHTMGSDNKPDYSNPGNRTTPPSRWSNRGFVDVETLDKSFTQALGQIRGRRPVERQQDPYSLAEILNAFSSGFKTAQGLSVNPEFYNALPLTNTFAFNLLPEGNPVNVLSEFPVGLLERAPNQGDLYMYQNGHLFLFHGNGNISEIGPSQIQNFLPANTRFVPLAVRTVLIDPPKGTDH